MKKLMLICAPATSRSGYGDHARDLIWSFIEHDKYDVKIIDVNWGETPRNALDKNDKKDKKILNCIMSAEEKKQLNKQPDIYVDIRIPNEFQTYGKFNIGITAGVETTGVSSNWIENCNKMDLVIVPSEHSKSGFVNSIYDQLQDMPNGEKQKVGELKLEKPMEVLFEGIEDVYEPIENTSLDLVDDIKEDFAFLHVGLWGHQPYGEDRKDIHKLVKIFYESFANKKEQPALILKTNGAGFSILDREDCLKKIKNIKSMFPSDWDLPNVYLLHGKMDKEEMNKLYNHPKVKAMVSFTHGEGFGRPLLEATMVGLPVIAPNWSGQCDFLNTEMSMLIGGELNKVPSSAVWENIVIPESQWFYIDENQAYKTLNYAFNNIAELQNRAKKLMKINREKFTLDKMTQKLDEIVEKHTKDLPSQVSIKLPKLKKVVETA